MYSIYYFLCCKLTWIGVHFGVGLWAFDVQMLNINVQRFQFVQAGKGVLRHDPDEIVGEQQVVQMRLVLERVIFHDGDPVMAQVPGPKTHDNVPFPI